MLSSVLNSPKAIRVNIEIMRAFVRLRRILASHEDLARKLEELERRYDAQFRAVFKAIRQLPPAGESIEFFESIESIESADWGLNGLGRLNRLASLLPAAICLLPASPVRCLLPSSLESPESLELLSPQNSAVVAVRDAVSRLDQGMTRRKCRALPWISHGERE